MSMENEIVEPKQIDQEIPEGYKWTEVGIIPEDWEVKRIEYVLDELKAGVSVNSVNESYSINNKPSILKTSCIYSGKFYPRESKLITPKDQNRVKLSPQANTILISRMNTVDLVGETGFVNKNYPKLFIPDRLWMTTFKKGIDFSPRFLSYVLSSNSYRKYFKKIATGTSGSMKNIAKDSLLNLPIPFPPESEQTAIATALSDVDNLIESLDKLIAKKRAIKQATMQQLLTSKKRLLGFEGEWEVKRLGDIFKITRGQVVPFNELSDKKTGEFKFPVFSSQTLNNGLCGYYKKYLFESCITWTTDGANAGDVKFREGKFYCTNVCGVLLSKEGYSNRFVAEAINRVAKKYVSYVGNPKLMNNVVKGIKISIPKSIKEQMAIDKIISDMEQEIDSLVEQKEKNQHIKQGLMQELLTGRTRLIQSEKQMETNVE